MEKSIKWYETQAMAWGQGLMLTAIGAYLGVHTGIILFLVGVALILRAYLLRQKQAKMTFFEKNVNVVVGGLENNIKEIENWFKYKKEHPQFVCQELIDKICDNIEFSFIPAHKSMTDKSIGDYFLKILLVLKDCKPNLGNDIKAKYDIIQKQVDDIFFTRKKYSTLTSEQEKLIEPSYTVMTRLKNSMEKLITDLRDCVEIVKEERK